jgi:nucleoside-diphosphate-sugar epimerase
MTTTIHRLSTLPKAAQKATYNLDASWQLARSTVSNMFRFVTGKLKPYHGMMTLIHTYYDAIKAGSLPPVSRTQALIVIKTMDEIFAQLKYEPLSHQRIGPTSTTVPGAKPVLVTGGTGFLGTRLVRRLLGEGHRVRVLARKLSRVDELSAAGAEIFWGDVADLASFDDAAAGCEIVVHLAAGTSGNEKDGQLGTLEGTRNLIELSRRNKPSRIIYISSCSVYDIATLQADAIVSEDASLERHPERRGIYSATKQQAERLMSEYMESDDVPVVILRPGTIYGPGGDVYTPMMGFAIGSLYIVIGTGKFVLPFVFVDNLVDAIAKCLDSPDAPGQIFNVVDSEKFNKRDYMNRVVRRIDPKARVLYVPYTMIYGLTWVQEVAFGLMKRRPVLSRYRLTASQKNVIYDNRKLVDRLGWKPVVSATDAIDALVRSTSSGRS